MLEVMQYDVPYTASSIMILLGLKSRETFRKNYSERQNKFDFHYNYFINIALHIR